MQLDKYQAEAVGNRDRRLRVLAGAGSGKTRALVARIVDLYNEGVPPERILAVTFSRKAAKEMRERLGPLAPGVDIQTLHALGLRILKNSIEGWSVADTPRRRVLLRKALATLKSQTKFGDAERAVSEGKRRFCKFDYAEIYQLYEEYRRAAHLWDFDDMLVEAEAVLRMESGVRERWRQSWDHILVDETQDTDVLQWAILGHLVGSHVSLFVVGDIQQSIYGWRGAEPMEMLEGIEERFGAFKTLELPINYRSVAEVVDIANEVVRGRPGALTLQPHRSGSTYSPIVWIDAESASGEAAQVIEVLERQRQRQYRWRDMAILYRINAFAEPFEHALIAANIPYEIVGDWSFYDRMEIKDMLAYLQLAYGWDGEAATRVLNRPTRYLGEVFRRELAQQGGWEAVAAGKSLSFSKSYMGRRFDEFETAVLELQRQAAGGASLVELGKYVAFKLGYIDWLTGETGNDADEVRAENVRMLLETVEGIPDLTTLMHQAEECRRHKKHSEQEPPTPEGRVQLLTVHRAKGLEWPIVCLVGACQGLLPLKSGDPDEEVRVFYVGVTRAKDQLYSVSHGNPSPFRRFIDGEGPEDEATDTEAPEGGLGTWSDEDEDWRPEDGHGGNGPTTGGGGSVVGDVGVRIPHDRE
jgi:DNA helicase-2/ATP-dependent DNA helicase PcrA